MFRHVANYHLKHGQLWRCPVSWCTQWKGTPQNCIGHIRMDLFGASYGESGNLGRWLPPWTATREMWRVALNATVSGVLMDALLFSRSGMPLAHCYCVFGVGGAHVSLHGSFISHLRAFTVVGSQTGLGTIVFKAGGFCSAARSVSPEVVGMSPHIVNLAGRCLHVPRHSPPPLRLPRLFRNWSLVCACLGGVPLCRRSIFSCQNITDKDFIPSRLQISVYVGRDAGIYGFSHLFGLPFSMPRSGCNFFGGFGYEDGRRSQR